MGRVQHNRRRRSSDEFGCLAGETAVNMRLSRSRWLMLASLLTCTGSLARINTASLISSAMSPDCISWRISGICCRAPNGRPR